MTKNAVACVVCGGTFASDLGSVLAEAGLPVTCSVECTERLPGHDEYVRSLGAERWAKMKREMLKRRA